MRRDILYGLTLWQPWAWAVAEAGKNLENRSWAPSRVPLWLAIHAGRQIDQDGIDALVHLSDCEVEVPPRSSLRARSGHILAVCRVARIVRSLQAAAEAGADRWWGGPVGWVLDDVVALPEPVRATGAQGLWRVSGDVLVAVREQFRRAKELAA